MPAPIVDPEDQPEHTYDAVSLRAWAPRPRKAVTGASPVARVRFPWSDSPVPVYDLTDTRPLTKAEQRHARPVRCASCGLRPPRPCTCLCAPCATTQTEKRRTP